MSKDDLVIVLADPLDWGVGAIREITRGGRVLVEFEPAEDAADGERVFSVFDAFELELLHIWLQAA